MPGILHVLETCIYGRDLAAMEQFYGNTLGLTKMSAEFPRHVFFRLSPQSVLLVFNPEETCREEQDVPSHGASGPGHVAFAVDAGDVDAWRDTLKDRGVEIEREIDWANGAHSLYFRDPAGNSVELVTSELWNNAD